MIGMRWLWRIYYHLACAGAIVLMACGNFATELPPESESTDRGESSDDDDDDNDDDDNWMPDTDNVDSNNSDDSTNTGAENDTDTSPSSSSGWECPVEWSTYACVASLSACQSLGGKVPPEYACRGGGVCCDTTEEFLEGPDPCPVDIEGISCQFSWECWKADGGLLWQDYYCTGDNTLCCYSPALKERPPKTVATDTEMQSVDTYFSDDPYGNTDVQTGSDTQMETELEQSTDTATRKDAGLGPDNEGDGGSLGNPV